VGEGLHFFCPKLFNKPSPFLHAEIRRLFSAPLDNLTKSGRIDTGGNCVFAKGEEFGPKYSHLILLTKETNLLN
jgi:hypothetical protein